MFLLVSGRHVGAHPDGHQHGGSIQISINWCKKFLRISCIRKIAVTWNLARVFGYLSSFFSENLDFTYWMVLIFILIYFEWRDTENQQIGVYTPRWCHMCFGWQVIVYDSPRCPQYGHFPVVSHVFWLASYCIWQPPGCRLFSQLNVYHRPQVPSV